MTVEQVDFQEREPAPSIKRKAWVFVPLIIAFVLAANAANWVSRTSYTRDQLITTILLYNTVSAYVGMTVDTIAEATTGVNDQLKDVRAQVETLSTQDDKAKAQLLAKLDQISNTTTRIADANDELAKRLQDDHVGVQELPGLIQSFSSLVVGEAHAAAATKSPRTIAPPPWIMRPGNKLWIAIGLSLLFAVYFAAMYALTADDKKRKFSEKMLTSVTTFWLGLAGGITLPNM